MAAQPSSDGWKAFALLGSLGGMVVGALVLFWIAALRMSDARAHADADASNREIVAAAPAPTRIETTAKPAPRRAPDPRPESTTASAPIEAPPTPAPSAATSDAGTALSDALSATLKLFSSPNTVVVCDGASVGRTPVVTQVAPGTHSLAFGDATVGHKTLIVTVKAGETRTISEQFASQSQSAEQPYP